MAGNRGKNLEKHILLANKYYEQRGQALITQMPTPVQISKVMGNKVSGFLSRSTVDFHGTVKGGQAVYFDAKETKEKSFPVANDTKLHAHQIAYLNKQNAMNALCFLVVDFTEVKEAYFIPWPVVIQYLRAAEEGGRKSIPLKDCQERIDIYRISTQEGFLNYLAPAIYY